MTPSEGRAVLWIELPDGTVVPDPQGAPAAEHDAHLAILNLTMHSGLEIVVVFRRADLSKLLAHPNEPDEGQDVAVVIMTEELHDRDSS